jgi:hypothetical protein
MTEAADVLSNLTTAFELKFAGLSVVSLSIVDSSCTESNGTYALIFTGANAIPATGTYTVLSSVITAVTLIYAGEGYLSAPTISTQSADGSITAEVDHNALWNAMGGRMYEDQADDGVDYPYAVYSIISAPKDKVFGSGECTDTLLQLSIFQSKMTTTDKFNAYYLAHTLYDEKPLILTGSTNLYMREVNYIKSIEQGDVADGSSTVIQHILDLEITTLLN